MRRVRIFFSVSRGILFFIMTVARIKTGCRFDVVYFCCGDITVDEGGNDDSR